MHISKLNFLLLIFLAALFSACITDKRSGAEDNRFVVDKPSSNNVISEAKEYDELHLVIIDPYYQTWFKRNARPINLYPHSFYKRWNAQYTFAWNQKSFERYKYNHFTYPFDNPMDYSPEAEYSLVQDYQLFWYYRYVEARYGKKYNFPGFQLRL